MHQCNTAESAIQTFKAHFLSILVGVNPNFLKNRWDLLLSQAELTLNLLLQSHTNPRVSAWEYFNGPYNFNAMPMGPLGGRIIAHAKGTTRKSWDFWGKTGFYIGPSLVHYQCYNLIRVDTHAVVVSDTAVFQHHTLTIPELTTDYQIIHCLRSLTEAIQADRSPS